MAHTPVVMFTLDSDGDRAQRPRNSVEARFLAKKEVDDCPRSAWPAVIYLPNEGTAAVALVTPLAPEASIGIS